MIQKTNVISTQDLAANLQKHGYSGSIFDGNPRLAWHMLPLFTAIREGIVQTDKKIEF